MKKKPEGESINKQCGEANKKTKKQKEDRIAQKEKEKINRKILIK